MKNKQLYRSVLQESFDLFLHEDLQELADAIEEAINIAEQLKNKHPELEGALRSYTIPWLQSFIDSENQIGSCVELQERLDDSDELEESYADKRLRLTEGRVKEMMFEFIENNLEKDFVKFFGPDEPVPEDYSEMAMMLGYDDEFEYATDKMHR